MPCQRTRSESEAKLAISAWRARTESSPTTVASIVFEGAAARYRMLERSFR
jgi:hypothetical protein